MKPRTVDAVTAEQADIGFFAVDPARGAGIAFTPPYVLIEGCYLVHDASPLHHNEEVDRPGHRVAVGLGSAYDLHLSRDLKQAAIVRAATSPTVVDTFVAQGLEVAAGVLYPVLGLLLSPALAAMLLKPPNVARDLPTRVIDRLFGWIFRPFNRFFLRSAERYGRTVGALIRRSGLSLAWIDHLLGTALDRRVPGIRARIRHEARVRVIDPFVRRRDWHWLGLDGDVHNSTRTEHFAKKFPSRFFNVGIAEQNLVGVAAGHAVGDDHLAGALEPDELAFAQLSPPQKPVPAAYFIWRKPYMVAANHTFIHHMLELFGVKNVFESASRYPEINPQVLAELKPDFIFLSSEPYSFSEKHFDEFRSFSPASKVIVVDGEMFSWYGSRLRLAGNYFSELRSAMQ